jgi:hypothetical protein
MGVFKEIHIILWKLLEIISNFAAEKRRRQARIGSIGAIGNHRRA